MLRIDDKTDDRQRTIRTNDIPRNTTFKGTITCPDGSKRHSLWLHLGAFRQTPMLTVSLLPRGPLVNGGQWPNVHNIVRECSLVEDYEPVDVLMTVTPIK